MDSPKISIAVPNPIGRLKRSSIVPGGSAINSFAISACSSGAHSLCSPTFCASSELAPSASTTTLAYSSPSGSPVVTPTTWPSSQSRSVTVNSGKTSAPASSAVVACQRSNGERSTLYAL